MTEQELDLLKQLFESAGAIGSQGFEALVRYTFADGLTWLLGAAVVMLLCVVVFVVGLVKDGMDEDARGFLCIGSCLIAIVAVLVMLTHIPIVIEPAGTTVKTLLDKATR